jgi:hypothetical protein
MICHGHYARMTRDGKIDGRDSIGAFDGKLHLSDSLRWG